MLVTTNKKGAAFTENMDLSWQVIPTHQARSFQYVATGSLKPSKLLHHLETKHRALQNQPFERKKWEHEEQSQLLRASTSTNQSALRASYLVAKHIAKAMKPFTIGEELILPATADICCELFGDCS